VRAPVQHPEPVQCRAAAILVLALAAAIPAGAAPSDPLWLAAVESSRQAKQWSPGEIRLAVEMADDKGKVLETWDNQYRLSAGADGVVRTEVVSAFHDGKDETQKEREAQAKRDAAARAEDGARGQDIDLGDDPFDPDLQDAVDIRQLAGTRAIAGMTCVAFAFTLTKPNGATIEGNVWLDAITGLPVEFVSSPKPLPRGAHELVTTVRYADGLAAEVRVEGSGSLLFFKRRFMSVITLGGWFRRTGG
jgi:hypothetical protein